MSVLSTLKPTVTIKSWVCLHSDDAPEFGWHMTCFYNNGILKGIYMKALFINEL